MHNNQFIRETLLDGAKAFQAGKMGRRNFLLLCGLAGLATSAVLSGNAEAAAEEIVLWNWGGASEECHGSAFGKPFTEATGIALKFDTSGPLQGKIKEMVDSGKVTADVCDADLFDAVALGKTGHLEAIDYAVIDKAKTIDGYALEFGLPVYSYGYAFVYDTEAYGDNPSTGWADFFDTAKFPGKRSLYKWANGSLEAALMADGVAKDALYPIDMNRAIAKIKSIKADTIYWGAASEAHTMIMEGEVSMCMIWQNRGRTIEEETNGRYKLVTNEALVMPGAYIVPKGNPAGREAVMKFIAIALETPNQVEIFQCLGFAPANKEAAAQLSEADQQYAIISPANKDKVAYNDPVWWGENTDLAVNTFLEAIS